MSPPSATCAIAEPLSGCTTRLAGDTEPAPLPAKQWAIRKILAEFPHLTGTQANRMYVAYCRDVEDARRIGNDTHRSDADFIHWLMRQAPTSRNRPVLKRQWAVSSS